MHLHGVEMWGHRLDLAQDSDSWRALVNTLMNIRFLYKNEISCPAENRLASGEELFSMELVSQ